MLAVDFMKDGRCVLSRSVLRALVSAPGWVVLNLDLQLVVLCMCHLGLTNTGKGDRSLITDMVHYIGSFLKQFGLLVPTTNNFIFSNSSRALPQKYSVSFNLGRNSC